MSKKPVINEPEVTDDELLSETDPAFWESMQESTNHVYFLHEEEREPTNWDEFMMRSLRNINKPD